jgi:nucleoid-associated protein YgaU
MSIGLEAASPAAVANTVAGIGIGVAAMAGARIPAMLRCVTPPNLGVVPFDFNPSEISMSRSASYKHKVQVRPEKPKDPGSLPAWQDIRTSTISISKLIFDGLNTKVFCDTMLVWMSPTTGGLIGEAVAALFGSSLSYDPPTLTFQWGPPMLGFMYNVKLTSCKVKYMRFTTAGIPIRAEVNLTMVEVPSDLGSLPMNPTSGGEPGRRSHTVGEGESLQSIATANYGNPGAWRRIAEVNGITDPTRIRPGKVVYLPNADELADGAAR